MRRHTEEVRQLAEAFKGIRAEINGRFATNAVDIVAPTGEVRIHMDYIASSEVNALRIHVRGLVLHRHHGRNACTVREELQRSVAPQSAWRTPGSEADERKERLDL